MVMTAGKEEAGADTPASMKRTRGRAFLDGVTIYVAFLLVGVGCGWFPIDAVMNLLLNEPVFESKWFGTTCMVIGITGVSQSALFFVYKAMGYGRGLSVRAEQWRVLAIIVLTVAILFCFAAFWDVGAPHYPVVVVGTVFCMLVTDCTYFFVFPFIAVHYGGWLVAPVRTGTDLSNLVTALLGEAQNPSGSLVLIPSSTLFEAYGSISIIGLCAWVAIMQLGIGLRKQGACDDAGRGGDIEAGSEASTCAATPAAACDGGAAAAAATGAAGPLAAAEAAGAPPPPRLLRRLANALEGLACPRSMLMPVIIGTVADVTQWGVTQAFSDIGAQMTDPAGCDGARGRWVARTSFTTNRLLVSLGSVASTVVPCSRRVFFVLWLVQAAAAVAMFSTAMGLLPMFWTTIEGQMTYIVCYGLVGGLEGYLFTMAYRFIGDDPDLSESVKHSSSALLSLLNVCLVDLGALVTGALVNGGAIRCGGR